MATWNDASQLYTKPLVTELPLDTAGVQWSPTTDKYTLIRNLTTDQVQQIYVPPPFQYWG